MAINETVRKGARTLESSHLNFMGGRSWDLSDPVLRLEVAASSCFFGEPMYYQAEPVKEPTGKRGRPARGRAAAVGAPLTDEQRRRLHETLTAFDPQEWRGLAPAELLERAIDQALDHDPVRTLEVAARLRQEAHIRTTPQVIFVRAARHPKVRGTGLLRGYAERVMRRLDEPATQLAYHLGRFGKDAAIPNALKKCWRAMLEGATEYGLAKYRQESRQVKLVDVVNLVHPKSAVVDMLVKGKLKTTDLTWESVISAKGSTKEAWAEAVGVMGHMALLRNVRNLHEKGVDTDLWLPKLVSTAEDGQQLPFRYWSAYRAAREAGAPAKVLDAVENCLRTSIGKLPSFAGRVMSLCDNSGSAWSAMTSAMGSVAIAEIANLTGILTGMRADDGWLGIFGDGLETFQVRQGSSVMDVLDKAVASGRGIGRGTETGVWTFWDRAIRGKEHWDHVFVYSDMQAGHGGLYGSDPSAYSAYAWDDRHIDVAKLVQEYRAKVNPKVNVYLVQCAGYQDTIIPEFYDRTFLIGGWSEGVIRFAAEMARLRDQPQTQPTQG